MTPEQQRHQQEYYRAKRNYENAVMEKRRAENDIINIQSRRNQIINRINALTSERRRNENSLTEINKTSSKNNDVEMGIKDNESKLDAASAGLLGIGESSLGKPQNLSEVFSEKNTKTKKAILGAFDQLKETSKAISRKIGELNSAIRGLENEMEEGKRRERSLANYANEQQRIINNSSIEMAYHKKHMMA